jgi:hypothetical protein
MTRKKFTFTTITLAMLPLVACAGGQMHSDYKKDAVQPVQLAPPIDGQLKIQYAMPPESLFYSPGVDFKVDGDALRIAIRRCGIRDKCDVMAKAPMPPAEALRPEVSIPYAGQRVIMVYADGEDQVYP